LLVYDGQCHFCDHCVALIRRWDGAGRVTAVPYQDTAAWAGIPGLSRDALEHAMHLVSPTGEVFAAAAAAPPLLRLLPGGRILAAPLALPAAGRIAAAVYRWVARHRHRLGCTSPACHRGD
jgi:acetyl esterase